MHAWPVTPQETTGTEACVPQFLLGVGRPSLGVESPNRHLSLGSSEADISAVPSTSSALLKGDQEGTVVMLDGNSLLALADYSGSASDNDSS